MRRRVALLAAALGAAPTLQAQAPDSLVPAGVRAYQNLDFDAAAGLLARAWTLLGTAPDTALRTRVLVYLGATEIYRERPDSAAAFFGRIVRLDPRYRIDRLVFPPEVTSLFDDVRRATPAVAVQAAPAQRFQAGTPGFGVALFTSTFHEIAVDVVRADGSVVRTVYAGPIGDSLDVSWDGRTAASDPVVTGRYALRISSLDAAGVPARIVRLPLDVSAAPPDTTPLPLTPQADLLPERERARGGVEALIGGILLGTAVAGMPSVIAPDASLSGGRFVVAGVLTAIGVAGFVAGRGERELPENIAVNDSIRAAFEVRRSEVAAENAQRRATPRLTVQVGPPQVIEREER